MYCLNHTFVLQTSKKICKPRNLCMTQRYMLKAKLNSDTIITNEFSFYIANGNNNHCLKSQGREMCYFITCMQGSLKFYLNNIELLLKEGEILLIPHYVTWEGEIPIHTQAMIHSFNPQNDKVQHIISNIGALHTETCSIKQGTNVYILKSSYAVDSFLRTIRYHHSNHIVDWQFWNLKHQELLYLLGLYHQNETVDFFQTLQSGKSTFKHLVLSHFITAKNCSELATSCGYHLKTFSKLFKKEFNQTVYQWLQERKAEQIKKLILQPDIPFKTIIFDFDFTSASHLNKFSKKYFGDTPTKLRQRIMEENNV